MTERVKKIYKSAIKNKDFLIEIEKADGDKKPGWFASEYDKSLFVAVYYGWLVGKHGEKWDEHI